MPELPDITVYIEALEKRIHGATLESIRIGKVFLLRSVTPAPGRFESKQVREIRRIGKRIAIGVEDNLWIVLHLMIAGRLHWHPKDGKPPGRNAIASFVFSSGTVSLTEAGSKRRASLHLVEGEEQLRSLDPGGIDALSGDVAPFDRVLRKANHTVKRALTDPHLFSGIGNAYSDEILHRAMLSPIAMTQKLTPAQVEQLHRATRETLLDWADRLRRDSAGEFPEKVTAFRQGMAVHGRYGQPCPRCGAEVQRIRHADNETNYCPKCQTGGKLLADRALSRLLKSDWPRSLDEMDLMKEKAARLP